MQDEWFTSFRSSSEFTLLKSRPVAYFCAEFALTDELPIYAGGLGVLAGDMLHEASDQALPLVAVGLYYSENSTDQNTSRGKALLTPVLNGKQERLLIHMPLQYRTIAVQAWSYAVGAVTLYLLDTDVAENDVPDREITKRLYADDKELRFKQEMVLGIGGLRLLEALRIHPLAYHLNEGHSALLSLELTRHEVQEHGKKFSDEIDRSKQRIVFTNHTLVPAGNDIFSTEMVSMLLAGYAEELHVSVDELIALGHIPDTSTFSMTTLALRMAGHVNAVSELHAEKAKMIWSMYKMLPITNGIHIPTWDTLKDDVKLWEKHQENKRKLLGTIKKDSGIVWGEHELLLGWARRMVTYKRPLALFEDMKRFLDIARRTDRPIKVVFAGRSHESDWEGAKLLAQLQEWIAGELKGSVVYLPNYRLELTHQLVSGCDVWLNTPIVGYEACGTSGMKACLNGVLPLTTNDGWVAEADLTTCGWVVDSDRPGESLLEILETSILPAYYAFGIEPSKEWLSRMKASRELIVRQFSATTMLEKYTKNMYLPAITAGV